MPKRLRRAPPLTTVETAVGALALFRLVRVLVEDEILDTPRSALLDRLGRTSRAGELLSCPWCLSVWLAIPTALALHRWPLARRLALAPALSAAVGLLSTLDSAFGRAWQTEVQSDSAEAQEYIRVAR